MWKEKLKEFICWKDSEGKYIVNVDYLSGIAQLFPNLKPRKPSKKRHTGERWKIWQGIENCTDEDIKREYFMQLLETIASQSMEEGFSSFTWPTMIQQSNLQLKGEKNPSEESIWKTLFLIYSSVKFGNYLVNLDNVSDNGRRWLWQTLVTSKVVLHGRADLTPIGRSLKVSLLYSEPFFNTLALLGFWAKKMYEERGKGESWQKYLQSRLPQLGWTENTSLIIYGREEKGVYHSFPRLSNVVIYWLNPSMRLIEFLNSLVSRAGSKERELEGKEREKLVFYLFKYNHINGEILSKLIVMKSSRELSSKKGRAQDIYGAREFFSKL